jgi:hypothetical protein
MRCRGQGYPCEVRSFDVSKMTVFPSGAKTPPRPDHATKSRIRRSSRRLVPRNSIPISTDGMQVQPAVEQSIVDERLLDWVVFSVDGCDAKSYQRYRIRGRFEVAFNNMIRFHAHAKRTPIHVIWQYVVFRWNDRDDQLHKAIDLSERIGIPIWFDFADTWGRSRRRARDVRWLTPYLRPFTCGVR